MRVASWVIINKNYKTQKVFLMSSKYPYVSDEYKHLLNPNHIQGNPILFNQTRQQQPQQIVFLPGPQPSYANQVNLRPNHDSYAADEPNPQYPSLNQYNPVQRQSHNIEPTPYDDNQIIHKVQYGDTLEGLSLIYDVAISKIKQRNKIDSDSIYYLKQIVIPNPKAEPMQMAKTQQFYIEEFMNHMPLDERSEKVARYYLEENSWDMEPAIKAFRLDLEWERKNKVEITSIPLNQKHKKGNYYNLADSELKKKLL